MGSRYNRYNVGDFVIVDGGNEAKIVKVIDDDDEGYGSSFYLVQDLENQFKYKAEETMINPGSSIGTADKASCTKRQKTGLLFDSNTSDTSVPSAKYWSEVQKKKFNIKFLESDFHNFFEMKCPDHDDDAVVTVVEMPWEKPITKKIDAIHAKLIDQAYAFELWQSEASVEECVKTLFEIFNLNSLTTKVCLKFGRVDMLLSTVDNGFVFMKCAVEIKGTAPYDPTFREKCRVQLAAYMLSMAIGNARNFEIEKGEKFAKQTLFGLLHIGLTPIFYKTEITDAYLDAIANNKDEVPSLLIHEFVPIRPYSDRELMHCSSRSIIFRSYKCFKLLIDSVTCK